MNKLLNTLLWISPSGAITQRYSKLHLFDVDLRPSGGPLLKESDSVEPGTSLTPPFPLLTSDTTTTATAITNDENSPKPTTSSPPLNLGLLLCFDLRFPEPSLHLRRTGSHILTYPSAFTVATGRATHWETLLRARAIETQCFVVAAAQCGRHNDKRVSWGQAMVVGPWGDVMARLGSWDDRKRETEREGKGDGKEKGEGEEEAEAESEICVVDLDIEAVEKVRREMPLKRRLDVYPEI